MVTIKPQTPDKPVAIPKKIETPRLILRPWKKNRADAKALYALAKDPRVGPAAGWPPHRDVSHSMQVIREVLSTPDIYAVLLRREEIADLQAAGICEDTVGRGQEIIIGGAGLTYGRTGRRWLGKNEAELGYWIGVPFWGRGYAPEAAGALLKRAFEVLLMKTVWCGCYEGNERSRRVQEKCGFVYDHTDAHAYCEALREERVEHFAALSREKYVTMHGLTARE